MTNFQKYVFLDDEANDSIDADDPSHNHVVNQHLQQEETDLESCVEDRGIFYPVLPPCCCPVAAVLPPGYHLVMTWL